MTQISGSVSGKNWWGPHQLTQSETVFKIGPLHLRFQSAGNELTVSWARNQSWLSTQEEAFRPDEESYRYVFPNSRTEISLLPSLPDRSVSTRFPIPLRVLPHDDIRFFVASPLWVQLKPTATAPPLDIPTWRLSDTWFGPPTSGELGYSGLLPAYFTRNQLPHRSDLAITPVNIKNDGEETLVIERLSIPSDRLALYYSDDQGFWTDAITVEHTSSLELSNVQYHRCPPKEAERARQVAAPRIGENESMSVSRVFNALKNKGLSF